MAVKALRRMRFWFAALLVAICFPAYASADGAEIEALPPVPTELYGASFASTSKVSAGKAGRAYSIAPIFADDNRIWHHESVDVIATLKIVNGDNGYLLPDGGLTRQAAAKMVYLLSMGGPSADQPTVHTVSFPDVSADSQFADYIAWCLDNNIISGYQDGTFRPTDGLTRDAFLKMLLCSLGYSQTKEGYVGVGWKLNVESRASESGLMDYMPEGSSKERVERGDASLMIFNTLQADLVDYDGTGGELEKMLGDGDNANHIKVDSILQFAELRFPDLVRTSGYQGAKLINTWTFQGEFIGIYYSDGSRVPNEPDTDSSAVTDKASIVFDPRGGKVSPSSLPAVLGLTYSSFPTPTNYGYTFGGWHLGPDPEDALVESLTITEQTTKLYAHWVPRNVQVTLNPNGRLPTNSDLVVTATVNPEEITVQYGTGYGNLPDPVPGADFTGMTFMGWFDRARGGERIMPETPVKTTSSHTLYAHWQDAEFDEPVNSISVEDLSYYFNNESSAFTYNDGNGIPLDTYVIMFGDTTLAAMLRQNAGFRWKGSCYGMVSSAGLFYQTGDEVEVSSFNSEATLPSELEMSDVWEHVWMPQQEDTRDIDLQTFIDAMQVSQYSSLSGDERSNNENDYSGLVSAVQEFEAGTGTPTVICVFRGQTGHALLGYHVENLPSGDVLIYVYDPNKHEDPNCYITLTTVDVGIYTGWEYAIDDNTKWGTSYGNAKIQYASYENYLAAWNSRGLLN